MLDDGTDWGLVVGLMLFFYDEYWVFHKNTSGEFYEWMIRDMKKQMYMVYICFLVLQKLIVPNAIIKVYLSSTRPHSSLISSASHTRLSPSPKVLSCPQYVLLCVRHCLVYIVFLQTGSLSKIQLLSFSYPHRLCRQGLVLVTTVSSHHSNPSSSRCSTI